jgi:hypothetical protein
MNKHEAIDLISNHIETEKKLVDFFLRKDKFENKEEESEYTHALKEIEKWQELLVFVQILTSESDE